MSNAKPSPDAALKTKAAGIAAILDDIYPNPVPPLHHKDAYTLLIAVVLSARNRDVIVNQTTPVLFAKADNPADMVKLSVDEITDIIRLNGLAHSKATSIRNLSQLLLDRHNGQVPDSLEELEALPGVGHKTASVVLNQAFGKPAFPVDTHILRLAWRWGLGNGKNVEKTEEAFKSLYPPERWGKLHLQLIYFGREYCRAFGHDPYKCPICSKYGREELFEKKAEK
jgi:endonuclease-3